MGSSRIFCLSAFSKVFTSDEKKIKKIIAKKKKSGNYKKVGFYETSYGNKFAQGKKPPSDPRSISGGCESMVPPCQAGHILTSGWGELRPRVTSLSLSSSVPCCSPRTA